MKLDDFENIRFCDTEYISKPGERPQPVCYCEYELRTHRERRLWFDKLNQMSIAPYDPENDLIVCFYAPAEVGTFLALDWPPPRYILDLYPEFRNSTNGRQLPAGRGLVGALAYHGLPSIGALKKDVMRDMILSGGPWTEDEKRSILDYCMSDVEALASLFNQMQSTLDLSRALLRGRYMSAVAAMEYNGIPIDASLFDELKTHRDQIKRKLISKIDVDYNVFEDDHFRVKLFAEYLIRNGIPWPSLESGNLDLKDNTFKDMARAHPQIGPLRELRTSLSQLRLSALSVGKDNRNRCMLSPFGARTGRNTPSNNKFIFGPAVWLRQLIKPEPGTALAYIDWSQQEFGIAAKLSGDLLMQEAYRTGDPYLSFAKQAKAVPTNATKQSHYAEREAFKACVLGVNYGMGEVSLAARIGQPVIVARELLRTHRETYRQFWAWSDGALDFALFYGKLWTVFGWTIHVTKNPNPRMLRNFLIQANGAEMLRLAICLAVERGVKVCAPVHDAVLIEASLEDLDNQIKVTQEAMAEASRIVLDGFELGTDVEVIKYPERYRDKRGEKMWATVMEILESCADRAHAPCADTAHPSLLLYSYSS